MPRFFLINMEKMVKIITHNNALYQMGSRKLKYLKVGCQLSVSYLIFFYSLMHRRNKVQIEVQMDINKI